jgi:hypothetical protein
MQCCDAILWPSLGKFVICTKSVDTPWVDMGDEGNKWVVDFIVTINSDLLITHQHLRNCQTRYENTSYKVKDPHCLTWKHNIHPSEGFIG